MKGILHSICIGSLALALTAQAQQVQGSADVNANVNAKAKTHSTSSVHATTSANERSAVSTTRSRGNMSTTRFHQQANVRVNVNDRTRFTNVTRITSNGRTFDRAFFRDRDDRRFHLGFHDRIFFINNFSEVILINGCWYFLDDGIFWPAFIIGANCVPPPTIVFVAVG
jgi:hypothetical protein